jgi:hypothetical protein
LLLLLAVLLSCHPLHLLLLLLLLPASACHRQLLQVHCGP